MKEFSRKVAVITGAGSGIGRALALALATRGCILALADVNRNGLHETRDQVTAAGAACSTHVVDVADRDAVEAFAADVFRQHGAVHLVINNAGVTLVDQAERASYEDFNWIMNINFWGVVYGTKAFLPYLRQVDEAHIVNVSSLFGLVAMPIQSAYNASKFAVRGFTESLKMELAGSPIGVSCVHPGGIKTGIGEHSRVREDSISVTREQLLADFEKAAATTAERAAAVIIRDIEKKRRRILIGFDARLFDWVSRIFPGSYEKIFGLERKSHIRNEARRESKQ